MKWIDYEKLHDTWTTKKEAAVTSGALTLLTDFDKTVTSGINLPEVNRKSQITQDLPFGLTVAQIAGPGQTDPRVRRVRSVVPQPAEVYPDSARGVGDGGGYTSTAGN